MQYHGKSYIGKTERELNQRLAEHKSHSKTHNPNSKFYNAIRKYGFESFTHNILYHTNCKDDLNEAEISLIDEYDTINNGYNITNGGNGGDTSKYIDYSYRKHKTKQQNKKYGRNVSGKHNPHAKQWKIITPHGEEIITNDLVAYCKSNPDKLIPNCFRTSVYRGICYKGYRLYHV